MVDHERSRRVIEGEHGLESAEAYESLQEMMRLAAPGGIIGHADLRIGDSIATRIEDVTPEELRRRAEEMMRKAERN